MDKKPESLAGYLLQEAYGMIRPGVLVIWRIMKMLITATFRISLICLFAFLGAIKGLFTHLMNRYGSGYYYQDSLTASVNEERRAIRESLADYERTKREERYNYYNDV